MSERLSKAERLAVVGEGYNHVTHNMRNLFAAIHSLAQYERNAPGTSADAKAAFDQITAMADTLNRWARDLMAAGRPLELKPVRQQIEPVIYDSLSMLKPSIVEKAVEVEFKPDVLPDVQIDRTLLEQALVAILANAIDASPRKGRIVVVAKGDANDTVLVSVEDEGEGMSEDVKRKVFDQYFSTKPKSVGLGLTVAHRIVTLHGGKIEIDSQPDQGTRVHVHLPASAKR
jgi:two-component system sensor histidine kinase HydH